jgi:chorismate mutase-like protein
MKIRDWRRKIDAIDTAMLHILNLRAELALEVGRLKGRKGLALRVPEREQQILTRMKRLNSGPLSDESVEKIYRMILTESIHTQEANGCGPHRPWKAAGERMQPKRRKAAAA